MKYAANRLYRWRTFIKVCIVASLGLIAYAALGPPDWQLRPMLGWKTEHFLGFLTVTFIASFAWPRALLVGLTFMATAGLLEALQGLTPNRIPDLPTALSGAGGALLASVAAEVFMRARRSAAKALARSERDKIK